jgi:phosphate starvation-inducible PhoH-like protein
MTSRKKPILKDEPSSTTQPQISRKDFINSVIKKRQKSKFLSDNQKEYYDLLVNNQITICSGPAGVGKSYISMKAAVDLLMDPNNSYEKIIIVRPAVEAEEKLGSLPGNLEEKLDPYIFPSYYLLNKIIGKEAREKLKEHEIIEVFALAYMRVMNIDN